MSRIVRSALLIGLAAFLWPTVATAQYPSEVVGFNNDVDPPDNISREMFQIPEWNSISLESIVPNTSGQFDHNNSVRQSGYATEGAGAMRIWFEWLDASDPNGWVRVTTYGGAERPNPSLHTSGKVRFKVTSVGEFGYSTVGVVLGIRETGVNVPQLDNGGTTGDIEWVGVDTTPNGIVAGDDYIVDTTATGDDVQVYAVGTNIGPDGLDLPLGTAVIMPGSNGTIDTTPANDDQVRFGYFISDTGLRVPIPALTLPQYTSQARQVEWDLSTGEAFYNGSSVGGGITGYTGDGQWDVTRGTLEHIAFVNVASNSAVTIDCHIDELQFEAPDPDPVVPPTVVAPLITGDTEITITGLAASADQVQLYLNGSPYLTAFTITPTEDTVTVPAMTEGQVYAASQHDTVTGQWSDPSNGVTVLAEPSPFMFAIAIDEDGDDCEYSNGGWEFVPATGRTTSPCGNTAPFGRVMYNNPGAWQEVDIWFDDPNWTAGWLGGDGTIDVSPTDVYSIDSVWFTQNPGGWAGPFEVFLDGIETIDSAGDPVGTIHSFENGINYLVNERGQSCVGDEASGLSTKASYDGATSHRLAWTFPSTDAYETLAMYHNEGYACGQSPTFPDIAHGVAGVRVHMLLRNAADPNSIDPPSVVGPIIVGNQDSVQIQDIDPNAVEVQLYINGAEYGSPQLPSGSTMDYTGLSLMAGDSISATQTLLAGESEFAYPRVAQAQPLPPVLTAPIAPTSTSVEVTGITYVTYAEASEVRVYVNDVLQGTATPTGTSATVNLAVALATSDVVTATQVVNTVVSNVSDPVTVAFTAPALYGAPAAGDSTVRVLGIYPGADTVTVQVWSDPNDPGSAVEYSGTPGATDDRYDVPVSGLVAGYHVYAYYTVSGIDSVLSEYECVTVGTTTDILSDDFEYEEADYQTAWSDSGTATRLDLVTDKNTTVGGTKSLYAVSGTTRVETSIAGLTPTETEPVILNVNIYDPYGVDPSGFVNQWVQLNADGTADYFYMHIGILGWSNTDNVHYDFRAVGNGGPNWTDMDEWDAPDRTKGWHVFTMVHKGQRIDCYVDGKLALKNLTLGYDTIYAIPRIGAGYSSTLDAYYDDYSIETGKVRFNTRPPNPPQIAAPILVDDEEVIVEAIDDNVTQVLIIDESSAVIGTYNGSPDANGEAVVTLTRPLVFQELIHAQVASPYGTEISDELEVGDGNGDLLICIAVRENGDTGALGSEGEYAGDIEWIGATADPNNIPQGQPISPGTGWVTLSFDPTSDPIRSFYGSDDNAITETRGSLESIAVTVNAASANRSAGTYRMYVDNVTTASTVIADFESYTEGDQVMFQEPTYSGTTAANLAPLPSASEVTSLQGNSGQSELLVWYFNDTTAKRWARLTTYTTPYLPNPIVDLTQPITLDVLLLEDETIGCPNPGDTGVYCTADIDGSGDCMVTLADLQMLLATYGKCPGDTGYNAEANLSDDGVDCIQLADLQLLLSQYGDNCN